MKKNISEFTIITLGILLFFVWAVWKGYTIYNNYPNPPIQTYCYGETVQIGSFQITFQEWQWGNGSLLKTRFPDFPLTCVEVDSSSKNVRMGLIGITVEKICEGDDVLDMANVCFSAGAWGNQFDLDLFYRLNSEMDDMMLDLAVGETQQVTLPLMVLESQFTEKQWRGIDSRKFYINFQYYPEHVRFLCPCY